MREFEWSELGFSDPLEGVRRRITFLLLPLGTLAVVSAWTLLYLSNQLGAVDRALLLPIAVLFVVLELALWRWRLPLRTVWLLVLLVVGVYELLNIAIQTGAGQYLPGITPSLLWFPAVYLMAFTLLESRRALRVAMIYYALGLLALMLGMGQVPRSFPALNGAAQFALANLVCILVVYSFSHLRERYQQMHQMAHSDPLTGLPNRRHIEPLLEQEVARAERYNGSFAILLADLDHFKQINDRYSHPVGDQVLREVAWRLEGCLRRSDTLARWGGEEFLILAPSTNLEQARLLAGRMNEVMRNEVFLDTISLTLSVGVSCYLPGDTVERILIRADTALYRAKHLGRDRLEVEA